MGIVKFFNVFNILYSENFNFDINQQKLVIETFNFLFNTLQNYNFDSNLLINCFCNQIKFKKINLHNYIFNKNYFLGFIQIISLKQNLTNPEVLDENKINFNNTILNKFFKFFDIFWMINILTIIKQFLFFKNKILLLNFNSEYNFKLNRILKVYNNFFLKLYNFNIFNN